LNSFFPAVWILGAAIATATAAEPAPNCAPILSAMAKTLQVDHATLSQSNGHTTNGITAGGINYLQIDNVWRVSSLSPRDNQARSDQNLRNAKSYVCQSLPDSSIDGVAVANYRTRTETEGSVVESRIAISKVSGLAVEVDNDLDSGGGSKSHYSTRYSYTGIHAPPVQK
jgi:hypothetical protein